MEQASTHDTAGNWYSQGSAFFCISIALPPLKTSLFHMWDNLAHCQRIEPSRGCVNLSIRSCSSNALPIMSMEKAPLKGGSQFQTATSARIQHSAAWLLSSTRPSATALPNRRGAHRLLRGVMRLDRWPPQVAALQQDGQCADQAAWENLASHGSPRDQGCRRSYYRAAWPPSRSSVEVLESSGDGAMQRAGTTETLRVMISLKNTFYLHVFRRKDRVPIVSPQFPHYPRFKESSPLLSSFISVISYFSASTGK